MTNRTRIHRWLLLSALGMTLAVGIGSLSGWVPAMLAALANVDVEPVVGGGDFEMFWTAAGLAAEGDWATAYDLDGLAAAMDAPVDSVSFAYPPPLAQALRPLTGLDYPIALASWLGIGVLALLTVLVTGGRAAAIGIVAMLFSLYVALRFGQLAPLTMLCAYLGGRAIQADRRFLGGALLGLLVLKPQFVLGPMIVILATAELRRRVLAGVVASAGTVAGLSLVISPEGWSAWLSGLSEITSPAVSTRWDFSIRAVTDWLPSWGSPVASVLLGGVVIWVALRSASRTEDLSVKL
ncbi:MAG: DUF2029 domain-containing protein, partial [Acidimicrobiia bacterium]|nr:DUF2029 domain-containing protein [Acidimicrobiia bacterium]